MPTTNRVTPPSPSPPPSPGITLTDPLVLQLIRLTEVLDARLQNIEAALDDLRGEIRRK